MASAARNRLPLGRGLRQRSPRMRAACGKAAAAGMRVKAGTCPAIVASRAPAPRERSGSRRTRPAYRDASAPRNHASRGASSTSSPAYGRPDARRGRRRQVVRDQQHAHVTLAAAGFSRSRICAWMVTSSAVVGSSATSSGSPRERHRDHHALLHAARHLERVFVEPARSIGDANHPPAASPPWPAVHRWKDRRVEPALRRSGGRRSSPD